MKLADLVRRDEKNLTPENLERFRHAWAKELKEMPRNSDIWPCLSEDSPMKKSLITRSVRTQSGVAPFAVMTKPFYCPGECIYCPLEDGMPKSYLSDEPAAQRAKNLNFDPLAQVELRMRQLKETGHLTDKVDIIVVGGTFSVYPEEYKREFFKGIFDGVNGLVAESLEAAQKYNETAPHRIVGISIETRPDWITEEEIKLLRELGVTKIQMGVQAFDEQILQKIRRGHSLDEVAEATRWCRNAGLKICYHFMPNLPGSNPAKDIEMAKSMFEDPRFGPDYLKVYPAMTIPGTEMDEMFKRGEYVGYDENKLIEVLKEIKKLTPIYCRIDRLVRDISKKWISQGTTRTNLRQEIQKDLIQKKTPCKCIRCREVKGGEYDVAVDLRVFERDSLGGKELFLSFENQESLFSMLRLRLPEPTEKMLFPALEGAAIIREVHTYGQVKSLSSEDEVNEYFSQHRGLGGRLMIEAEKIARERGYQKMAVISAIGTREYYRKHGYILCDTYMVKDLTLE